MTTIVDIQRAVAAHYNLGTEDLEGLRRRRTIVLARHVAMYLCRVLTEASLAEIGEAFNRDHTTVLHAVRRIAAKGPGWLVVHVVPIRERLEVTP
jgi:chromosomal replication initiator protein